MACSNADLVNIVLNGMDPVLSNGRYLTVCAGRGYHTNEVIREPVRPDSGRSHL